MQGTSLERFAGFFAKLSLSDIPLPVRQKAAHCLLDVLECCACAPADHRLAGALASVRPEARAQGAAAWGEAYALPPGDAAFLNAVRGSLSYRNDLHRRSASHAGAVVCAAALAAAEGTGASPRRVLLGIIAGYDAMLRLGEVLLEAGLPKGYRSSALTAPFGAALAVAVTLGLNTRQITSAASFACHSAAGNNQWAAAGTGEDVFHAGWGARNGLQAAFLAAGGALGCADGLEGENGLLTCLNAHAGLPLLCQDLGTRWLLSEVEFKPMEACLMLQAPCQAAQMLAREPDLTPEAISGIEIRVCAQAKKQPGCDARSVETCVQAKMSLRYGVAGVFSGQTDWAAPTAMTKRLMERSTVRVNDLYTKRFPQETPALVRVTTPDAVWEREVPDFVPLTTEELEARFFVSCGRWLGSDAAAALHRAVLGLDNLPDIQKLTKLLRVVR